MLFGNLFCIVNSYEIDDTNKFVIIIHIYMHLQSTYVYLRIVVSQRNKTKIKFNSCGNKMQTLINVRLCMNHEIGMYTLYTVSIKTDNVFTKISYRESWFEGVCIFNEH